MRPVPRDRRGANARKRRGCALARDLLGATRTTMSDGSRTRETPLRRETPSRGVRASGVSFLVEGVTFSLPPDRLVLCAKLDDMEGLVCLPSRCLGLALVDRRTVPVVDPIRFRWLTTPMRAGHLVVIDHPRRRVAIVASAICAGPASPLARPIDVDRLVRVPLPAEHEDAVVFRLGAAR